MVFIWAGRLLLIASLQAVVVLQEAYQNCLHLSVDNLGLKKRAWCVDALDARVRTHRVGWCAGGGGPGCDLMRPDAPDAVLMRFWVFSWVFLGFFMLAFYITLINCWNGMGPSYYFDTWSDNSHALTRFSLNFIIQDEDDEVEVEANIQDEDDDKGDAPMLGFDDGDLGEY